MNLNSTVVHLLGKIVY